MQSVSFKREQQVKEYEKQEDESMDIFSDFMMPKKKKTQQEE